MAARKTAVKKTATPKPEIKKSDAIRDWFKANPNGTAVQCQKALAEQDITIGSGHAQQILNKIKGGGKIDVSKIKLASEFVSEYGDIDSALEAIEGVGGFIQACGNPAKAKAALEAYQSVAAALK
ncbi:hypothetical protein [Rubinisphaera sp.]|uniref:hypothetical protein n=1 Tax=Rubinisphaera sp. TaxID=2024857 RepID=UPI000C1087B1|nr:hypothetical protein [Rubinisphaera sp.]MBV12392.1 hypothetical protein [Rubinisphaera sp.]HCS50109.1 hypothetical protein [Planctomycetaceae bacterium]|tara:strand:+ start:762 stop:1136 length:375 start_codon:yes stop_codon:yes gene_type:complete